MHLWYRTQQKAKGCHEDGSRGKLKFAKVFGCLQGLRVQLFQLRCFQRVLIMQSIHCHKRGFQPASCWQLTTPGAEDLPLLKFPYFRLQQINLHPVLMVPSTSSESSTHEQFTVMLPSDFFLAIFDKNSKHCSKVKIRFARDNVQGEVLSFISPTDKIGENE